MRRCACRTRAECMEQWGDPLTLSAAIILPWTTRLVHTSTWCRLEPGRAVPCRRADRVWTWCTQEHAANAGRRESVASRGHTCCHQRWHEQHSSRHAAICLSAVECRWMTTHHLAEETDADAQPAIIGIHSACSQWPRVQLTYSPHGNTIMGYDATEQEELAMWLVCAINSKNLPVRNQV